VHNKNDGSKNDGNKAAWRKPSDEEKIIIGTKAKLELNENNILLASIRDPSSSEYGRIKNNFGFGDTDDFSVTAKVIEERLVEVISRIEDIIENLGSISVFPSYGIAWGQEVNGEIAVSEHYLSHYNVTTISHEIMHTMGYGHDKVKLNSLSAMASWSRQRMDPRYTDPDNIMQRDIFRRELLNNVMTYDFTLDGTTLK
jgi:hypothetical protein